MNSEEVVIIGAGIAGLSCLNFFLDSGISPLVIEASEIGVSKVCGDFIAPYAVKQLERWHVLDMQRVHSATFFAEDRALSFNFLTDAASIKRCNAEMQLYERAIKLGGRVLTKVKVLRLERDERFTLFLDTNQKISARHLIVASRSFCQRPTSFPFYGYKAYVDKGPTSLQMYSMQGGYLGMVAVSGSECNVACLVTKKAQDEEGSFVQFLQNRAPKHLKELSSLDWQQAPIASFGKKRLTLDGYAIGDAAFSYPPASGSGFSHAIASAKTAVDCFLMNKATENHSLSIRKSKLIHELLIRPTLAKKALSWLQEHPRFFSKAFVEKL